MIFYQWYCQAFGAIIGIASCVYCYLNGDLLLYSNLDGNFDAINFNGILASYTLYPLCFLTFIMAILIAIPNMNKKKIINIEVTKINAVLIYLTILIGVLGCGIYFIIPTLLLLLNTIISLFKYYSLRREHNTIQNTHTNNKESEDSSTQLLVTKTEMAIDLLNKNANINFITEVTGLSRDYITNLKVTNLNGEEVNRK